MRVVVRSERWALGIIVTFYGAAYALLFRHWQFGSSAFDLGIFDQAVWHLSRFEAPASTISGFTNILGDHFHPVTASCTWIRRSSRQSPRCTATLSPKQRCA